MRHGRLPLVWGGNGRGDRKGGERVIGGEWVYRIGITLSENYPDGVENSLSAYNLVLVYLPRQIKGSAVRMFLSSSVL